MSATITSAMLAVVLITQLGAPSYRQRVRAMNRLEPIVPAVAPYLEAATQHRDPEIARRASSLLAHYYQSVADQLSEQVRPAHWPRTPWLDMLPPDYPDRQVIVSFYLSAAQRKIGPHGPPEWDDYRLATRLYLRQLIMDRRRLDEVHLLLDRMAEQERQWIQQNGIRYSPPVPMPVPLTR